MKATLTYLLLIAATFGTVAQKVENDDMYFTGKDRAKIKTTITPAKASQMKKEQVAEAAPEEDAGVNPTDSYSARNVNPEYSTKSGNTGNTSKADYFVENYVPTGVNGKLQGYSNSNSYSNYNNPYAYANPYAYSPYSSFGNMGWGYPMGMGSPYGYGYGSGMSMSYGMSYGYSPWSSPWMSNMMSFGYGGYYGNPYGSMYDPFMSMYCPYSFYGYNSYGYGGYSSYNGYPSTGNNDSRNVRAYVNSRRTDRSSTEDFTADDDSRQTSATQSRTGRAISGGRARSADLTTAYYERGWRNNTTTGSTSSPARSHWSNQNPSSGGSDTNGSTDRWGNSSGRSSSPSWNSGDNGTGGSSWSTGGGSSPSRSSVGGGGGSSGGGRSTSGGGTRGRD